MLTKMFGTGEGFSADEITTGYLSASRILAGSITASHLDAGVAGELNLTANKSLKLMVSNMLTEVDGRIQTAIINIDKESIAAKVMDSQSFQDNYSSKTEIADEYTSKEDLRNLNIGSKNYIKYSSNITWANHHGIYEIPRGVADTAIVGVSVIEPPVEE